MTITAQIPSCSCNFEAQHELYTHPALRALEKEVLGCDYGGTSWTTRLQADRIPGALGLTAGSHLLEIGAGTGWPGIHLAKQSGCDVTLLDVPVNSLRHALQRAGEENMQQHCHAVAASGSVLPFADHTFSAISHSDVLCCLPQKTAMLKECRRVARQGTNMLFYVIAPAPGLPGASLEEACRVGPPFVGVEDDYIYLLNTSAWVLLEKTDLTAEYLSALQRLVTCMEDGRVMLEEVLGSAEFMEQMQHRRLQVSAIERGLLVREMYLVEAAG